MTRVFYIGDSTVQLNKIDTYPQTGMSQVLHLYMADHVQVMPHGKNGRSTKSFLEEGLFEPVRQGMGEGDKAAEECLPERLDYPAFGHCTPMGTMPDIGCTYTTITKKICQYNLIIL